MGKYLYFSSDGFDFVLEYWWVLFFFVWFLTAIIKLPVKKEFKRSISCT